LSSFFFSNASYVQFRYRVDQSTSGKQLNEFEMSLLQEQPSRTTRPNPPIDDEALLNSARVRAMVGGVSPACLWRWERDPEVMFPPPDVVIKKRKYWRAGTIRGFSAARTTDGRAANRVIFEGPAK
jgi:hypothetical protein